MILDHIDGVRIPEEAEQRHKNVVRTLQYLAAGLKFLNDSVSAIELEVRRQYNGRNIVSSCWNDPDLAWAPHGLIACMFHWYAVSACNYVRLVGWLAKEQDESRPAPKEYANTVIPKLVLFRNKVAAHVAKADPHREDQQVDLDASVMYPIGFVDDSFCAGMIRLKHTSKEGDSVSRNMFWSLTKTHAELTARYWPERSNHGGESQDDP